MTRRKNANRLLALLCCMAIALSMLPAAVYADVGGGVPITEDNFPDENFRSFVEQYDTDGTPGLSDDELAAVTGEMDVSNKDIKDLTGIEHFTGLTGLDCSYTGVSTLDLSALNSLTSVNCEGCSLTELKMTSGTFTMNPTSNGTLHIAEWTNNTGVALSVWPDDGYYLASLTANGNKLDVLNPFSPDVRGLMTSAQVTANFEPYLTGMTPGQTVTKGTVINANLAVVNGYIGGDSPRNVPWTPTEYRIGDWDNPVQVPDDGNIVIDTAALSVGHHDLVVKYEMRAHGVPVIGDGNTFITEIPFTVEEAPYVGPSYYYLTVENGTGDGAYTYGSKPVIEADAPAEGKVFDKWVVTSGTGTIENEVDSKTTFTMGFGSATVTATYKDEEKPAPQQYQLTVKKGSGSGTYAAGTQVDIKADKAAKGWVFDRWVLEEGKGDIADKDSSETTFTMAESDAVVKAVYEKAGAAPADKPEKLDKNKGTDDPDAPKTGDDQMLFSWLAVMSAALAGIYVINRKRETLDK